MLSQSRHLLLLAAAALLLGACEPGWTQPDDARSTPAGGVKVRLSSAGMNGAGVVRATVTIGGGAPLFTPIVAALSRDGGEWTASVSNVPAGRQRQVDVVAYDANGMVRFRGGSTVDVVAGGPSEAIVVLEEVTPPAGRAVSSPMVSVAISSGAVAPGGSTALTSLVTDPAGQALSYAWVATCGRFGNPTLAATTWTAPSLPYQRCQLTFTASNPYASTSVAMAIDVQADPSTITMRGRRVETCWQDAAPGTIAPLLSAYPAPDTATLTPPDVLLQTGPGIWSRYAGGSIGADGVFHVGSFDSGGAFAVPGILPSPSRLLWFRDSAGTLLLVQTPSLEVDLGYDRPGRCQPALASPNTSLALQLAQLASWDTGSSELQLASSGADLAFSPASGTALARGANSASLSLDWSGQPLLLPPDVLWVSQLVNQVHPSGWVYRSAAFAARISGHAPADAAITTVAAALSPVDQTGALPVQWTPIDFERALSQLGPSGRVVSGLVPAHRLSVIASPFAAHHPAPLLSGGGLQLATFDLPAQTVAVGLATPIQYGQFLPPWWIERRQVRYAVAVGYQAAGATDAHFEISSVTRQDVLPAPAGAIEPTLTPVRDPAINGSSALADLTLVTTTPSFSWLPPSTGTPSAYQLDIYSLQAVAGSSKAQLVARYLTGVESASIPPGVLAAGTTYFARITALAGDVPYLSAPLRYSPAGAWATAYTGTFTP